MKMILVFALFASVAGTGYATEPENGEKIMYSANVESSEILWTGRKVTGKHHGTVNLLEGGLEFEGDRLVGGGFTIDMSSIACTDLQGEMKGKLEGHLKSDDFFGIENHPTATFKITDVAARDASGGYKVTGDLTIKGITKPIKFNAVVADSNNGRTATAEIQVDRSEYNVRYGSGSFFDNLGDKTIYDEFDLSVTLALNRS